MTRIYIYEVISNYRHVYLLAPLQVLPIVFLFIGHNIMRSFGLLFNFTMGHLLIDILILCLMYFLLLSQLIKVLALVIFYEIISK